MNSTQHARPRLILFLARYQYRPKNAVAATLAWVSQQRGCSFEIYYDALRSGRHYGGGRLGSFGLLQGDRDELALLTGGLMAGARHMEALAAALRRFETTIICAGEVAFSNVLATLADETEAVVHVTAEQDLPGLYDIVFSAFGLPWPRTAVMLHATPAAKLEGIDAYLWPEIFYRQGLGVEAAAGESELRALLEHGVIEILTSGLSATQQAALSQLGFRVDDLGLIESGDDHALVTARIARRWQQHRKGWMVGDPVLASYWLPTACREQRAVIYGAPQSRVIELLKDDFGCDTQPAVLGRQYDDSDFFTLSKLGQSFQVIDPGRPPLPVMLSVPPPWSSNMPNPQAGDPTDEQLLAYAREGRVLVSLAFWTGMIRETENLYAVMDLMAMTGLQAGIVLTVQSLAYRPSPLDLLPVARDQGGVFPGAEILLGSCGTGAAIESLLRPEQLSRHLGAAREELSRLGLPSTWWPKGWWATMDAQLIPLPRWRVASPVRWTGSPPYFIQLRFPSRADLQPNPSENESKEERRLVRWEERLRKRLRGSHIRRLFHECRPYENFAPGPVIPDLAAAVRDAGFSYMLTKSGFGQAPRVLYRDGDFVALNYTAGQWDGWTPFETVNHVHDLARAERKLLRSGRPGWLLGTIDTCLWAFSGELWDAAPGLAAIARFAASGGVSGKLINVPPRVIARYARLVDGAMHVAG